MFVDKVQLIVKSGKGGDGAVSFRREKFVPKGGPDGGDGGKGGDVILIVDSNLNNLYHLRHTPTIKAGNGGKGRGKKMHGKKGRDAMIKIPPGTTIYDESGNVLCDLLTPGEEVIIERGGRGGKGNVHFASSRHQVPETATDGKPGEKKRITLELKSIADVGIVGYPNAGKSTFLRAISSATPKISNYPFTTLSPNLGVVEFDDYTRLTFADIPGVIEGASHGKGLGFEFLRHIERTKLLLFMLDITSKTIEHDYIALMHELTTYSATFSKYPRIIAINKIDLTEGALKKPAFGEVTFSISALKGTGIKPLLEEIRSIFTNTGGTNGKQKRTS